MKKILFIFLFITLAIYADEDVTLQWDANTEPDLLGYKIYYDEDSGAPYNGTDITEGISPIVIYLKDQKPEGETGFELTDDTNPEITLHDLKTLIHGYTFAATAFDTEALESDYSNEVSIDKATLPSKPTQVQNLRIKQSE